MTESDKPDLFDLIGDVMAFYGKDTSPFALSVWWAACKPFDLEQIRKAFNAHAMDPDTGVYPPKPADLVRLLRGTATDRARMAWSKVFDAMQRVGSYQSVVFDDPVIHAVVDDLGGWMTLCRSDLGDLSYTEHRFCEAYRAYAGRPDSLAEYPAKLLGQTELDNRQNGRRVAPPVLVGDAKRAQQVLAGGAAGSRHQFTVISDAIGADVERIGAAA